VLLTKLQRDFFYFSVVPSKKGWVEAISPKALVSIVVSSAAVALMS